MAPPEDITRLLLRWREGDSSALEELVPMVERELHRLAHRYMNQEKPGHLLQTTALVHEAFIRLVHQQQVQWQNRAHFFAIAAQMMRRVLLNHVRDQTRTKRGGQIVHVSLIEAETIGIEKAAELIALDDALNRLAQLDERKCRVVELRYFGGLSVEETAEVLQISIPTVMRDWKIAKAWLARELTYGAS